MKKKEQTTIHFSDYVDEFIRAYCANGACDSVEQYESVAKYISELVEHYALRFSGHDPKRIICGIKMQQNDDVLYPPKWKQNIIYIAECDYVKLDESGYVTQDACTWPECLLVRKHISELETIIKAYYEKSKRNELPKENGLKAALESHAKDVQLHALFLNAVMFRIMEMEGLKEGPRLALDFAIKYKADIEIPIIYGIDTQNPNIGTLVQSYIDAGGSIDIECLGNYYTNNGEVIPFSLGAAYDLYREYYNQVRFLEEPPSRVFQIAVIDTMKKSKSMKLERTKGDKNE